MHDTGTEDYTVREIVSKGGLTRILIVDDHPAVRFALLQNINRQPDMRVCGEAGSRKQALALLYETSPDGVIIDLALPDVEGLSLVEQIHDLFADLFIIVYSMYDERVFAERVLGAGASGFVMKNAPTSDVVEAIRTVILGEIYVSKAESIRLLNKLAIKKPLPQEGRETRQELTAREKEIFEMLGDGVSIPVIAERLGLRQRTVEAYRRQVRKKLGLSSVNSLLQFAVKSRLQ